ncbi:MAG TPA: ABC transporter permease, partial [Cyclobacteriaceae bacterium]
MGLTVSAEEIIRDRKILKRESFLNLSWNSYLVSKIGILFLLSAIQTLLFVLVGNLVLEIKGITLSFWFILFSTSCLANVLGLNISSAFNSAVTVYVLIPLLLIPQMILSGVLFSFDKLHSFISNKEKVPIVADMMASRWAYEALAVEQFIFNNYEQGFYEYEKKSSIADFKSAFVADELEARNQYVLADFDSQVDTVQRQIKENLEILKSQIVFEPFKGKLENSNLSKLLSPDGYTKEFGQSLQDYIKDYRKHYQTVYNDQVIITDKKKSWYEKQGFDLNNEKDLNFNESLSDLVKNVNTKERLIIHDGRIIQQIDPIFQDPNPQHLLDYRTGFFFPEKYFLGIQFSTFTFNSMAIWLMSALLYLTLYFELLRKLVGISGNFAIVKGK